MQAKKKVLQKFVGRTYEIHPSCRTCVEGGSFSLPSFSNYPFPAEKSQDQVIKVFDYLTEKLGIKVFQELFPVILTDNGVEFQFPERLDKNGEIQIFTAAIRTLPGKKDVSRKIMNTSDM